MIRDLPQSERPRERLAEKGASFLSSIELIAILLGSGTQKKSALGLASELLEIFGSLERLSDATVQELLQVKGIGPAKALTLQAAFALWKRLLPKRVSSIIDSAERAYAEIYPSIAEEKTEVLFVLLRDARRSVLHKEVIGRGTLNQVLVHPREVFCSAIRHRAHSVIIAHNHPSGDCSPSLSDLEMTRNLTKAAHVLGIPLVDHLIIGRDKFYSFRDKGLIEKTDLY